MKERQFRDFWSELQTQIPELKDKNLRGFITFANGMKFKLSPTSEPSFRTNYQLELKYYLPRIGLIKNFLDNHVYLFDVFLANSVRPAGFHFESEYKQGDLEGFCLVKILDEPVSLWDLLGFFNLAVLLDQTLTAAIFHNSDDPQLMHLESKYDWSFRPFNDSVNFFTEYWASNHAKP